MKKNNKLAITDHAIVRFMERASEFDRRAFVEAIIDDETKGLIKRLGNGKYPIGHGCRAVIKNNVIITIIDG